jgi:hypothetical protein
MKEAAMSLVSGTASLQIFSQKWYFRGFRCRYVKTSSLFVIGLHLICYCTVSVLLGRRLGTCVKFFCIQILEEQIMREKF